MASFAAQAAIRSKWTDLVESTPAFEVPEEVTSGVRNVVGWLKQASLEVRQAGRRTLSQLSNTMGTHPETVTILHFNDVYNVEPQQKEPVGGAARFCTALKSFSHLQPLVLFSGDVFSPSMLSTCTKGEHMVDILNECGVRCSVFGNHDFDFGLDILSQWVARTNFPWLMSNVIDNETGRPLGDGKITHVIDWSNKRIGLLGLVEREWLETITMINPDEVTFIDIVEAGRRLAAQLKQEGCDYVIALTHMRTHNDRKLAENVDEVDLILGGHDHVYEVIQVNGKYIIKSGTDFRQFSKITLNFPPAPAGPGPSGPGPNPNGQGPGGVGPVEVSVEEVEVTESFDEDPIIVEKLEKYTSEIDARLNEVLGVFSVELDGRFSIVRTQESNLGNWVCDVVLAATGADLVILNSGTIRLDGIHPPGAFTLHTLSRIVPMDNPLMVIEVTGKTILEALENGVSMYPRLEGRFPQVAGMSFAFDPSCEPGQRVDPELVRIGDEYLELEETYHLALKKYMYDGRDGYTMFKDAKVIIDDEQCPELGLALQNHFQAINIRLGRSKHHSKHRQSLVTLSRRHRLVKTLDSTELDGPPPLRRSSFGGDAQSSHSQHPHAPRSPRGHHAMGQLVRRASLEDLEQESCTLSPRVEGRIVELNPEKREELLQERKRVLALLALEADSVIQEAEDEG